MCRLDTILPLLLASVIFAQFASAQRKQRKLEETIAWLTQKLPVLAVYEGRYKNPHPSLRDKIHFRQVVSSANFDGCKCELIAQRISFSRIYYFKQVFSFSDIDPGKIKVEMFAIETTPLNPPQPTITISTKDGNRAIHVSELSGSLFIDSDISSSDKYDTQIIAHSKDAADRLAKALRQMARLCQGRRR